MKKLALGLLLVLFVGLSAGATLEDFSYFPSEDFEYDFAGGETFFVEANFTNAANQNVPLGVEVVVEGGDHRMSSMGEEFDIVGSLSKPDTDSTDYADLAQVGYEKTSEDVGVYRFRLEKGEARDRGIGEGLNSLDLEFKSDVRIKPDNYMFDISIRSVVGFGEEKNLTVSPGEGPETVSFEGTGSSVSLDAGVEDVTVNVTRLDSVTVSPPEEGSSFVGGFTVEKDDEEKDLSGSVTVTYDDESLSSRDLNVYFYNASTGSWENIGGTHYRSNNSVVASVDHFSTYAAYAEPQPPEEEQPQPTFTPGFDPAEQEQVNETDQTENNQPPVNDTEDEEQPPQDDQQQDQEQDQQDDTQDQGPPEDVPAQAGGPTGLFTAEPGSVAVGFIVLLIVAAFLQYTGQFNFLRPLEKLRG